MVSKAFSIEDGNLNSSALITSRARSFSDIDLTFTRNPSGDLFKKVDAASVKQALKNLLLTGVTEKPFNDNFGGGLGNILFELIDEDAADEIEETIQSSIDIYEPRVIIQKIDVIVKPDGNRIHVKLVFRLKNTQETVTLDTTMSRVR